MKVRKIFGVPLNLWLFPPIAILMLLVNTIQSAKKSGKDEEEKNGF